MWNRLMRLLRSLFGAFFRSAENPELILRQLMDDMRNKIPQMNNKVAEVIAFKKQLEMKREGIVLSIQRLKPTIEAAVKAGESKKVVAMSLIAEDQIKQKELSDLDAALATATTNADSAMRARSAYESKVRQQVQECQRQLSRSKMAEMQTEMASLMGSFEVGDDSDTLQRVTEQVDEKLARAQARQDVASTSVDSQLADVEATVAESQADEVYKEYQRSLGIIDDVSSEKTMSAVPVRDSQRPVEQT